VILPAQSAFRQESAQLGRLRKTPYAAARLCDSVGGGQRLHMQRGTAARYYRYPSPSLWSGPLWVRPDFFQKSSRVGHGIGLNFDFAFMAGRRHNVGNINLIKGRAECKNLNLSQFRFSCWRFRAVLRMTDHGRWSVRPAAPSLPTRWAATHWRGPLLARQAARFATTRAFATDAISPEFGRAGWSGATQSKTAKANGCGGFPVSGRRSEVDLSRILNPPLSALVSGSLARAEKSAGPDIVDGSCVSAGGRGHPVPATAPIIIGALLPSSVLRCFAGAEPHWSGSLRHCTCGLRHVAVCLSRQPRFFRSDWHDAAKLAAPCPARQTAQRSRTDR